MEDRLACRPEPGTGDFDGRPASYLYAAVFDGHGSPEAAEYAKKNLLLNMLSQEGLFSDDKDIVGAAA